MLNSLLEIALFLFCVIFCFYLPGKFFIGRLRLQLQGLSELFTALVAGMVFFIFLFYVLSWTHAELLAIPLIIILDLIAIQDNKKTLLPFQRSELFPGIFIALSALIFSFPLLLWGIYGNKIVYRYDDLW